MPVETALTSPRVDSCRPSQSLAYAGESGGQRDAAPPVGVVRGDHAPGPLEVIQDPQPIVGLPAMTAAVDDQAGGEQGGDVGGQGAFDGGGDDEVGTRREHASRSASATPTWIMAVRPSHGPPLLHHGRPWSDVRRCAMCGPMPGGRWQVGIGRRRRRLRDDDPDRATPGSPGTSGRRRRRR